jgi:hypothetical protein
LPQNILVHWTQKKIAPNPPLFTSLPHFSSNWPRLPSPFLLPNKPPPQDPSLSARWFLITGELCLHRLHLSLSLKAPPTYIPNTLTTTVVDETLTSAAANEQVRRRPSFLLEDDLVTHRPLSLYLDYIYLPMLLFSFLNLTLTTSAGLNSHLGHNIDGGNKGST